MNEFQTSTRSSDYHEGKGESLFTFGHAMKRTRRSRQARRRELLHDAAIITAGFVICVVAICIIYGRGLPWLPNAAIMAHWPNVSV